MSEDDKFFRMFGGIFFAVGVLLFVIGGGILLAIGDWFGGGIPFLMSFVFGGIGGGMLIAQMKKASKVKNIQKNGVRYTGKIYGYIEDKRGTMNGDYLVNLKVHYFDDENIEREGIIPTGFIKGSGEYPIGATIDIIVLGTNYTWVKGSVRYEHIDREEELMDDKPVNVGSLEMVAVKCPNCGATFSTAKGYVGKCPYCGSALNC